MEDETAAAVTTGAFGFFHRPCNDDSSEGMMMMMTKKAVTADKYYDIRNFEAFGMRSSKEEEELAAL